MHDDLANLVHSIFDHGLALRDRLEAGAALDLEREQAALKSRLLTEEQAQCCHDFGGPPDGNAPPADTAPPLFLGGRYALTCWLDELFSLDATWGPAWRERPLEASLYGTTDRAWKFWQQAERAEARPGTEALEVFYLCVMLGFRGERAGAADKIGAWAAATRERLTRTQKTAGQPPLAMEPPTNVPALRGRDRLRRLVVAGGMALMVLIPLAVLVVARQLGQ